MIYYDCFYYTTCTYVIFERTNIYFLQEFDTVKKIEKLKLKKPKKIESNI